MGIFKDRVARGKCGRCGKNDITDTKVCVACQDKAKEFQRNVRMARKVAGLCVLCGKRERIRGRAHCQECRAVINEWNEKYGKEYHRKCVKKSNDRLKTEVLSAYGGKCQCCGLSEEIWLTIDHIDGKGADHRRELTGKNYGAGNQNIYRWLRKNGFPPGFQVLCWCCNWAKSHGGCPHEKMRQHEPEYMI